MIVGPFGMRLGRVGDLRADTGHRSIPDKRVSRPTGVLGGTDHDAVVVDVGRGVLPATLDDHGGDTLGGDDLMVVVS